MPRTSIVVCFCFVSACGLGGSDATVFGLVVDHAGAPLAGVDVKILNSAYLATSGPDGRYSVPFAPGNFTVIYSRDGMTSTSVEHSIQGQVQFPASDIQLFPIPKDPGLFILLDQGPKKLEAAKMDKQRISDGWYSGEDKYFCTGRVRWRPGQGLFDSSTPRQQQCCRPKLEDMG